MDFVSAVKSCLRQYAGFSGCATRSEFWWFYLFRIAAFIGAGLLQSGVLILIAVLGLMVPAYAVGARRLHDVGLSGWWQLLELRA